MDTLLTLYPNFSLTYTEIIFNMIAVIGAVLLAYGVFLESERNQDSVFIVAAICLLTYALWIGNKIFTVAMAGLALGSLVELIEILLGKHKHNKQKIDEYKHP